jgi:hypothetical protein
VPICAVLSEHGIKIAPSIFYARAKTPITLAELDEANLGNALWTSFGRLGVIGVGKLWHAAAASALRLAATRSAGYWPWPERSSAGALPKQRTTMARRATLPVRELI